MSSSAYGIPLNIGITHGMIDEEHYSLLCNAMPDTFMLSYEKPVEFKSLGELNTFTQNNITSIIPGTCVYIKESNEAEFGKLNTEYIWNKEEWVKIGNPFIKEYLNIYNIYYAEDQNGDIYPFADLFMHTHIKNIQSNIKLYSILDMQYAIKNNEFVTYAGVSGVYGINNNATDSLLNNLLTVNINCALTVLFRRLCSLYNVPLTTFNKLIGSTVRAVEKVLDTTYYNFITITETYLNVDFSTYINYIGASFASFKEVINAYITNSTLPAVIDPTSSLSMIDKPLLARLNINSQLRLEFLELLQIINDIIYRDKDENASIQLLDFYYQLKNVATYFIENNDEIVRTGLNIKNFCENLCEGIGGIVTMALYLSIFSNCDVASRTTLYFHFLAPDKYIDII